MGPQLDREDFVFTGFYREAKGFSLEAQTPFSFWLQSLSGGV